MNPVIGVGFFCILLLGGIFLGFSGSVDDAHISYWSAWVLANKGEILNYNLERVEQSSALLQVLLLALLHKATSISVVTIGHLLTIFAALSTIVVLARFSAGIMREMVFPAVMLLSTAPFFVYWAYGGMEGPLLALLLLSMAIVWQWFVEKKSGIQWVFLLSVLVQVSRPEMLVVCCVSAIVLGVVFLAMREDTAWQAKRILALVAIQFGVAAMVLAFRFSYFGDLWPQPVSAKAGGDLAANVILGLAYIRAVIVDPVLCFSVLLTLIASAYVVVFFRRGLHPGILMVAIIAFTYTAFIVSSGGDWMAAGRFWVPVVPLYTLMSAYVLIRCVPSRHWQNVAVAVLVVGHITYLWRGVGTDFNGMPLWSIARLLPEDEAARYSFFERHGREHLHDIPTLAFARPLVARINSLRPAQPLRVMVGQAGMVMYYLNQEFPGKLHVTDRNGLVDRTLTGCPVATVLPRTRNGLGNGYEWMVNHRFELANECGFQMPDLIFDIDAAWNRRNADALRQQGYVLVYQQQGHISVDPSFMPLRKIGASQYLAVSPEIYSLLGSPEPILRIFDGGT